MLCLVLGDPFQAFVSSSFFLVSNEQSPTKVVLEKEKMLVQTLSKSQTRQRIMLTTTFITIMLIQGV